MMNAYRTPAPTPACSRCAIALRKPNECLLSNDGEPLCAGCFARERAAATQAEIRVRDRRAAAATGLCFLSVAIALGGRDGNAAAVAAGAIALIALLRVGAQILSPSNVRRF
jgi:hypothetical protein